ncbi:MAG: sulfatase-like hydrolase/transferase, partial [Planctomycetaceae bacterium]
MKIVTATIAALLLTGIAYSADRPPNIVLIMADDVGVETLGSYGGESYKTPHIDALAKGGLRFNHCYSMPVCHPTRIALLTGRYPFRLKHPRWGSFPKAEEENTLAHLLKRAGYATAIAGKWQLAMQKNDPRHPQRLGFDQSCLFGWHEGPRYYDPLIWQNGRLRTDTRGKYGPDLYVEFLADFMKHNRKRPFFAYYSMALCHDVTDDLKKPVPFGPKGRYDNYAEMIAQMDKHVGRLVKAIDDLGLRENTVILFTGDNGTPKSYIHTAKNGKYIRKPVFSKIHGKMLRGGKGDLTDAGTNVPLIANWKGTVKPGRVANDLVDFSDWLPT